VVFQRGFLCQFITQVLWSEPNAFALVGFQFFEARRDKFAGSLVEGPTPTTETIASSTYVASRPLYLYVNESSLFREPRLRSLFREYVRAAGASAYLSREEFIPIETQPIAVTVLRAMPLGDPHIVRREPYRLN
jgi:ABC-type phosphate transport system substrate-binding protein